MQTRDKFFEDLSKLMTNAMGIAQDAKSEMENAMRGWFDSWIADRNLVTREEFEAVQTMARNARDENEALKIRIEVLESKPAKKPRAASVRKKPEKKSE